MTKQDSQSNSDEDDTPPVYGERTGPRVVIDPITGYPVVTRRPGAPMVTNEDIKRWLEDFPTEVREPAHAGYFDMPIDERSDNLIYDSTEPSPFPGYPHPRWAIDPVTGFPYVRARPGVPKITTEDVKRELEDFP